MVTTLVHLPGFEQDFDGDGGNFLFGRFARLGRQRLHRNFVQLVRDLRKGRKGGKERKGKKRKGGREGKGGEGRKEGREGKGGKKVSIRSGITTGKTFSPTVGKEGRKEKLSDQGRK